MVLVETVPEKGNLLQPDQPVRSTESSLLKSPPSLQKQTDLLCGLSKGRRNQRDIGVLKPVIATGSAGEIQVLNLLLVSFHNVDGCFQNA